MIESINVGRYNFCRENGVITVQWLGHGTAVKSDPAPRLPTLEEHRMLALHLAEGYQWVRVSP